jgi:hypothetical protein
MVVQSYLYWYLTYLVRNYFMYRLRVETSVGYLLLVVFRVFFIDDFEYWNVLSTYLKINIENK